MSDLMAIKSTKPQAMNLPAMDALKHYRADAHRKADIQAETILSIAITRIEELEAEAERLRSALRDVHEECTCDAHIIANAALETEGE
jgi:hypothetical protein